MECRQQYGSSADYWVNRGQHRKAPLGSVLADPIKPWKRWVWLVSLAI